MSIEGFEPPTLWFVAIHSHPLSYIPGKYAIQGGRWELNPRLKLPQSSALPLGYAHHENMSLLNYMIFFGVFQVLITLELANLRIQVLGCRQVVRRRLLVPIYEGSNPPTLALNRMLADMFHIKSRDSSIG